MNTKLYVGNLAATTTYNELMELFSTHGNIIEIKLPVDPVSGRGCGFACVTMATPDGARAAVQVLDGMEIGMHSLTVSALRPLDEDPVLCNRRRTPRRRSSCLF